MTVSVTNFLAAPMRGNARVARMRSEYYTPPATSLLPKRFLIWELDGSTLPERILLFVGYTVVKSNYRKLDH